MTGSNKQLDYTNLTWTQVWNLKTMCGNRTRTGLFVKSQLSPGKRWNQTQMRSHLCLSMRICLLIRIISLPSSFHNIFLLPFGLFFLPHFNNDPCVAQQYCFHRVAVPHCAGFSRVPCSSQADYNHWHSISSALLAEFCFLRWFWVACFYPKSQWGLTSLPLFWVIKNFLCTCFLPTVSAFMSHRGEEVVDAIHCSNSPLVPFFLTPWPATIMHSKFQGIATQLSRATFCLQCTKQNVFSLWPSATFSWFLQLGALWWVKGW